MENQIRPQKWVILEIDSNIYKVFASWGGGYLDGAYWKLNSGISKVEEDSENYYFYGYSGSCYVCNKKAYGVIDSYNYGVLNDIIEKGENKIVLLENNENWFKFFTEKLSL